MPIYGSPPARQRPTKYKKMHNAPGYLLTLQLVNGKKKGLKMVKTTHSEKVAMCRKRRKNCECCPGLTVTH